MKTAAIAFAASLAFAGAAQAQEHDHAAHAGHAAHGAAGGQEDHAHDPAHYATAQHAEHRLRDTIAALQAGAPDYETMGPELAQAVRDQSAAMTPTLAAMGALQSLTHIGEPVPGAHQFEATFASGATSIWTIRIDGTDIIQGLMVQ